MVYYLRMQRDVDKCLSHSGLPDHDPHPVAGAGGHVEGRDRVVTGADVSLKLGSDLLHPFGDVDQGVDGSHVRGAGVAVQQEPDSRELVLGVDADHEVALVSAIKSWFSM